MVDVARYIDGSLPYATAADDLASGLNGQSEAAPKKFIRNSLPNWPHGSTIYIKYGYHYDTAVGNYGTISRRDCKIIPYGNPEDGLPVWDALYYEPFVGSGGWTPEGQGVWSKKIGTGTNLSSEMPKRMWVGTKCSGNKRGQRDPGTARSRTPNVSGKGTAIPTTLAEITAWFKANPRDIWHPGNAALGWKTFVYTGSDDPNTGMPPQFYNGICFAAGDSESVGADSPIFIKGANNLLIEKMEVWGGQGIGFRITASNVDAIPITRNVTIRKCVHRYGVGGSFGMAAWNDPNANRRGRVVDCVIEDCYANTMTNPLEVELTEAYGQLSGAFDMFQIIDGAENCTIRRCTAVNSFHVAYVMGAGTFNSAITEGCVIENCYMFADTWHPYARGFSTYNTSATCVVRRNTFDGQNVTSQFAGKARITANLWINMRPSMRKPGTDGWLATGNLMFDRLSSGTQGLETYVEMVPSGALIDHNYVEDPYGALLSVETFTYPAITAKPAPQFPDNAYILANNALYDRRRPSLPWFSSEERTIPIGVQNHDSNAIYKGIGAPAPFARMKLANGSVLNYVFDNMPGTARNLDADPQITIDAVTREFTIARTSPLRRAGKRYAKATDARGRPFMFPPTIGPIEFTARMARA